MPKYLHEKYNKEVKDFKKSASALRKLRDKKGSPAYKKAVTKFKKEATELRVANKKLQNYKKTKFRK